MQVRRIDGRTYTDPDIISLIDEGRGSYDPYLLVRQRVSSLLEQLKSFEVKCGDALERICILASLAGFVVKRMDAARAARDKRDAVLMYTNGNRKKGMIFYDPNKPRRRVIFSIGHEITHSFFPTSKMGSRFRAICKEGSKSSRELEMLCHFGASELTMPLEDFQRAVRQQGFSLSSVYQVQGVFDMSFEASLYRMAQTAPFPAAAGRWCFRRRIGEENAVSNATRELFPRRRQVLTVPQRKYRRQAFYYSATFPRHLVIPWNKSIPVDSCVYRAAKTRTIEQEYEVIPVNGRGKSLPCFLEAVVAPYQPDDADPDWPDVLFLLRAAD